MASHTKPSLILLAFILSANLKIPVKDSRSAHGVLSLGYKNQTLPIMHIQQLAKFDSTQSNFAKYACEYRDKIKSPSTASTTEQNTYWGKHFKISLLHIRCPINRKK